MRTKEFESNQGEFQPGEAHWKHKLRRQDVKEIRRRRKAGVKLRVLSAIYGVSDQCIWKVCNGKTWNHVE